ncbi:MAG: FHA domain-containing protein [Thermoleophilia bacterium]
MTADVLRVTAGQDHGARFGLRGSEATIGRGPVMDIVLTDPRVSRRHARVAVREGALVVEDLESALGTTVNGVPIRATTTLAPGDRVGLGATELTVLWTPGGSYEEPAPPPDPAPVAAAPPPPAPAPAAPATAAAPPAAPLARREVLLPIVALALAVFALVALAMPVLGDSSGTESLWQLEQAGFGVLGLLSALVTGAAAGLWLAASTGVAPARLQVAGAAATAVGGGLIAGLPLFLAALDLGPVSPEAGLVLLVLAGVAVIGCAVAGVVGDTAGRRPSAPTAAPAALLAAGGCLGGLLAVVGAPLTWVHTPFSDLGGFEDGFQAGGWLVPIALAVAASSVLTWVVARSGEDGAATAAAALTGGLGGMALAFVLGAGIGVGEGRPGIGMSLATTGCALALTTILLGGAAMALRWRARPSTARPSSA